MLESSGRTLAVLLSLLLAGTWGNSVLAADQIAACSTGFASAFEAGASLGSVQASDAVAHPCACGLAAATARFLKPPTASMGTSSSSYLQSLPAEPKFMLMVLVGFLCVSLLRDWRLWLTVVASILSISHHRLHTASSISQDQPDKRRLRHLMMSCDVSFHGDRQLPPCLWRQYVPFVRARGGKKPSASSGVLNPPSFNRSDFLPSVAFVTDGSGCPSAQLAFAQLARGPPP